MTRIRATWTVAEGHSGTFDIDSAPDAIGQREVFLEISAAYPFDEIDSYSVEWEVVEEASDAA